MSEFILGRLKFVWKDSWTTSTSYIKDDIVRYGGNAYICLTGHTSAATSTLGLEADSSKWSIYSEGIEHKGDWVTSTRYKKNDIVKFSTELWICTTGHTASPNFTTDSANWTSFVTFGTVGGGGGSGTTTTTDQIAWSYFLR